MKKIVIDRARFDFLYYKRSNEGKCCWIGLLYEQANNVESQSCKEVYEWALEERLDIEYINNLANYSEIEGNEAAFLKYMLAKGYDVSFINEYPHE